MDSFGLMGRSVLITGVGNDRGLGYAMAKAYAAEGCRLVLADIAPLKVMEELAGRLRDEGAPKVLAMQCDVSDEASVRGMAGEAFGRLGGIDVLVNNAGVMRVSGFLETTAADWDLHCGVMLKGTFLCTREVAGRWVKNGIKGGRVINLSSVGGRRPWVYSAAYCACKAGIVSLTQVSAAALAPYGINVNGIAPGDHETDMLDACYREGARLEGISPGQFKKNALRAIPLGRVGTAEDIAFTALFLSSGMSKFITGQVVNVNGGAYMQ